MAIKLHRCSGTFIKGPHPCWKAQKALDDAGIPYELVIHSALRFRPARGRAADRAAQAAATSSSRTARSCAESAEIAARAKAGTLVTSPQE